MADWHNTKLISEAKTRLTEDRTINDDAINHINPLVPTVL